MNVKKVIWLIIGVLFALCIVVVVFVAAAVGNEASSLHTMLEDAVKAHAPVDEIRQKLTADGYQIDPGASPAELKATGSPHKAIIYNTWLTVHVDVNAEGKASGYHMDRASSLF